MVRYLVAFTLTLATSLALCQTSRPKSNNNGSPPKNKADYVTDVRVSVGFAAPGTPISLRLVSAAGFKEDPLGRYWTAEGGVKQYLHWEPWGNAAALFRNVPISSKVRAILKVKGWEQPFNVVLELLPGEQYRNQSRTESKASANEGADRTAFQPNSSSAPNPKSGTPTSVHAARYIYHIKLDQPPGTGQSPKKEYRDKLRDLSGDQVGSPPPIYLLVWIDWPSIVDAIKNAASSRKRGASSDTSRSAECIVPDPGAWAHRLCTPLDESGHPVSAVCPSGTKPPSAAELQKCMAARIVALLETLPPNWHIGALFVPTEQISPVHYPVS